MKELIPVQNMVYQKSKTLIAVDISGSLQLGKLSPKIQRVLDLLTLQKVSICVFDTEVKNYQKDLSKKSPAISELIDQMDFFTHGGTEFQPVIDLAKEEGYNQIIVFSDGYLPEFKDYGIKCLWVLDEPVDYDIDLSPNSVYYI